jgi:hypothetical protein
MRHKRDSNADLLCNLCNNNDPPALLLRQQPGDDACRFPITKQ